MSVNIANNFCRTCGCHFPPDGEDKACRNWEDCMDVQAPSAMREKPEALRAEQLHHLGNLFGIRFVAGCSNGCAELYVEDDGWWHYKMTFDRLWLKDLGAVVSRADRTGETK